ncbi:MAG: hypothetical protein JWM80_2813, partial [Cyanobacteria bacterium RYN_339]|nr:hypothetical protein [Cyanobacteria bacterium RYN_339]
TQNAPVANALLAHVRGNPKSQAEVAKIMRWAMETHGKGQPPTEDPKLLATLIGTQNAPFGKLMRDFLAANPTAGKDVLAVERWAIQTRGKGMPPTHNARLLATLIATQEKAFGKLLQDFLAANPGTEADVADVARWAIETHGKVGLPPTNNAKLLAALIGTQDPAFGKLMQDFLAENPGMEPDVAEVERWAIETKGVGVPPGHNAKLLGTLIQSREPVFGKLMLDFLAANPGAAQDVAEVERWAIETKGTGTPPTQDAKLLGTLIRSREAGFGQLMLDYLAAHPAAAQEIAAVERWAIETKGVGLPPTTDPELLATLIGCKEPQVAQMFLAHLKRDPASAQEVARVAKWAIATQGVGEPPTNDPRLLASLIGLKVPKLAAELDAYIVKNPKKAAEVAAIEKWLIASKGKPKGLPPCFTPGVLLILAKYAWT